MRLPARLVSIPARIMAGFLVMLLLQAAVAVAVWEAEREVDVAAAAGTAAQAEAGGVARVVEQAGAAQLLMAEYLRSGAATDAQALTGRLDELEADASALELPAETRAAVDGRVQALRASLAALTERAQARREAASALVTTGTALENALAALVQAASRTSERAVGEAATEVLVASMRPLGAASRYAAGEDRRDAERALSQIPAAREALRPVGDGQAAPRLLRVVAATDAGLAALPPAIQRLQAAIEDRDAQLGGVRLAAAALRQDMAAVAENLSARRGTLEEAMVAAREGVRATVLGAAAAAGVIGVLLAALAALSITRPLGRLAQTMAGLAGGALHQPVPDQSRRDEVGGMAVAVDIFRRNMISGRELEANQARLREEAGAERRGTLYRLAEGFEVSLGGLVGTLAQNSASLQGTAESMDATATRTGAQAALVAEAAAQASEGVATVAAATEQLAASVQEIGRQVSASSRMAGKAVLDAQATDRIVQELARSAERVGQVVGLVTSIAGQTNLLALNATIEAARAGGAGLGFAVVATEVKALARQTAEATGQIGEQIAAIQAATQEAVSAIGGIRDSIGHIDGVAGAIAAAVEEQGAATAEIARSVSSTAQATRDVTAALDAVRQAAADTGQAARQVLGASQALSGQARDLSGEVERVASGVRAA